MSFQMQLDGRGRKSARFLTQVHTQLQNAFVRAYKSKGMTQQRLADKMDVDRSFVNRKLSGEGNLTLKTIADFAWALDCDIDFELVPTRSKSHNYQPVYADPVSKSSGGLIKANSKQPPEDVLQISNAKPRKILADA